MGKNDKEKKMIYEWGAANYDRYQFTEINGNTGSYFQERGDYNYIREYYFDTVSELKDELNSLWEGEAYMESIIQAVLVALMKNKVDESKTLESIDEEKPENPERMPAYIYNF